jgi:hypothetical protein
MKKLLIIILALALTSLPYFLGHFANMIYPNPFLVRETKTIAIVVNKYMAGLMVVLGIGLLAMTFWGATEIASNLLNTKPKRRFR